VNVLTDSDSCRILVSLATYNERGNLQPLTEAIRDQLPGAEILIIDDNSPDGTGKLADEIVAADSRVHVVHRSGKLGLGTAILAAMHYAMANGYDLLINMDADFSHHPRYLPALVAGMKRFDVMIGSRYVTGGGALGWPLSRRLISRCVNATVRILMRVPAHDTSGAYRCYRVAKLKQTDLDHLLSKGYSFQQEILYRCRRAGCRIGEIPIIFENRRAGASKVNSHEAARSMGVILWVGLQALFGADR
jgi:dolichol-phosphate mannosyltransferase